MDVSASDVREVRFGTTRIKAGYDISEVDQFLDRVEKAIAAYTENYQRAQDEADALRSQVQQVQRRLESAQVELDEARAQAPAAVVNGTRDTIVVETTGTAPPPSEAADIESTTENPVVVVASIDTESGEVLADLTRIRDDVRAMLERQLELVDSVQLPDQAS